MGKCQCGDDNATRSAEQREQMDGDSPEKVETAEKGRQNGNEGGKTVEVHLAQWVDVEYIEEVHEKIQRKV